MKKFDYGEFSAEVDATDAEFVEKYEKALDKYKETVGNMPETNKQSEKIKYVCGVFFEFFDTVFEAEVSTKMFGATKSVDKCVSAFVKLVDLIKESGTDIANKLKI